WINTHQGMHFSMTSDSPQYEIENNIMCSFRPGVKLAGSLRHMGRRNATYGRPGLVPRDSAGVMTR
ncbi:MAG TPA: hypothetical protein VKK81_15800, partial [Candidatus Binatia bacterium]|nr:hypothetical protein [Candidatus Binatia bacterium]